MVTKDKLNEIEQGREEPNPSPSLNVTGKKFETPTVSAQQVERVTQNIATQLVDHVNQEVGQLKAIVSQK